MTLVRKQVRWTAPPAAEVAELLRWIPPRPPYEEWVRIIAAVGSVLEDTEAAAVLAAWSPEDRPGEYRAKLRARLASVNFGTLVHLAKANGYTPASRPAPRPIATPSPRRPAVTLQPWPEAVAERYREGRDHLMASPATLERIDAWRGWPAGTAATLAEDSILSSPITNGNTVRGLAFAVHAPAVDDLGFPGGREIGFHCRHRPAAGERAQWTFHPNAREDGTGIPALPFVIGCGFVPFARHIVVTEGQWDAVTLAAAGGWLANDASWPERVSLFGLRGAGNWRPLLDHWHPHFPKGCTIVLFPQDDEPGWKWTKPGDFADALRALHHLVKVVRLPFPDLNDAHRAKPITPADLAAWLS
jgi:hypothetical protein